MGDTFWDLVARTGAEHPDRVVATDDHGRELTSAGLVAAAEVAAAGLHDLGLRPGDVLSWQLPTVLEAPVLLAAGARLGLVQNPVIPLLRHREVGHIAGQLGTKLLLVAATWKGFDFAAMAADLGLPSWSADYEGPLGEGWRLPAGDPATLPAPPTAADEFR